MDLSKVTDVVQLKAMAYDQIAAKERAEANLRVVNGRIAELEANPSTDPKDVLAKAAQTGASEQLPGSEPGKIDAPAAAESEA